MTGPESNDVMIGDYSQQYLLQRAREMVQERTKDWEISNMKDTSRIPKFSRNEIQLGGILGEGGFFAVSEVKSIMLDIDSEEEELEEAVVTSKHLDEDYLGVVQNRKFMEKHCMRNHGKDCRYAFKRMRSKCRSDPSLYVNTIVDMAIEAKFLSSARHPNIIKMRGISDGNLFQPDPFLVLDRLYDTLLDRISQWKKKDQNGLHRIFDFQKKREHRFFADRLTVAYDIASALSYLHDLNIIYRDLKPNNVGFDVRGDAKLFDFGLAVEFDQDKTKNGTFKLTGDTGTVRYMAPEVAQNQPYKETADVYSFGILLWQICKLDMPFAGLEDHIIERKVVLCGSRPKIDPKWPNSIRRLLQDCFASSPRRPTMEVVCDVLRHEINSLSDKKLLDDDLMDSARSAMSARYVSGN